MAVNCPQCHSENTEDSSFCSKCGTQLSGAKEIPPYTKNLQTPIQEFAPGTKLSARYEIVEELGRGGMGEVYLAEDTSLKREVAIKVLPQHFALDYRYDTEGGERAELFLRAESLWGVTPWSITPDGRYLAYTTWVPETWDDIRFHPSLDEEGEPLDFLINPESENQPAFSPDGRWIAYTSDESGTMEIYVREFPGGGGKIKVSAEGGWAPLWSPDSTEIFYINEGRMMAVKIDADTEIKIGNPRLLFEGAFSRSHDIGLTYDVSPDGRRFLMMQGSKDLGSTRELIVIQNWFEELKRLFPRE